MAQGRAVQGRARQPFCMHMAARVRRGVLVFYALLLGLWLPFVCWGTWADPSHAHAGPHLVFAAPPSAPAEAAHVHTRHTAQAEDQPPTGAARPLTAFLPFLLMTAPDQYRLRLPARRGAWLRQTYPTRSADLAIPTPPPRLAA
jgi:hypothetical protein